MTWFGAAYLLGGALVFALFGQPEQSSAVNQLADELWLFLLDVTVITWLLIGFGEQVVFRGFLLNRLLVFTGDQERGWYVAAALQALWFGSGHASQGPSGMLLAGTIGFVFAMFFLSRGRRSLWPLVVVHAGVDSIVLTLSWLTR